jgi:hypothetical protein
MDTLVNLVNNPIFEQIVGYVLARQETRITKQVLLIARHMGLAEGWGNFRDLTADATTLLHELPIFDKITDGTAGESRSDIIEK